LIWFDFNANCCHLFASAMSITIHVDLPDALVKEARDSGLLESERLGELLSNELRRARARRELGGMLEQVRSQPGKPLNMEEIQAEVNDVREKRRREGSR
jgi:hypothetical protein